MWKYFLQFCIEGVLMSAPQVINMPDILASFLFYGGLFGILVSLVFMLYNKYDFKLPILGNKYVALEGACREIYTLSQSLKEIDPAWGLINILGDKDLNIGDLRYQYIAEKFSEGFPIFGNLTKSYHIEKIDLSNLNRERKFSEDCRNLLNSRNEIVYENLKVKNSDLKRTLKEMKNGTKNK